MSHARILLVGIVVFSLVGGFFLEAGSLGLPRAGVWKQKKKIDEEEDDTPKPKTKKITPIEEEKPAPTLPSVGAEAVDLGQAAREAKNAEVKKLYLHLALPCDRIEIKKTGVKVDGDVTLAGVVRVEPIATFVNSPKEFSGGFEAEILDRSGKKTRKVAFAPNLIVEVSYYELEAIASARDFLARRLDRDPNAPDYLRKDEQLLVAETALSAVLRWHQSAWERKVRKGEEWAAVEEKLRDTLLGVLLDRLGVMIEAKSWDPAFELVRHITDTFGRPKEHARIAKPIGELLTGALADSNYTKDRLKGARQRLRQIENQFPNSDILKPISKSLREQAEAMFEKAKELIRQKKNAEAQSLLKEAEETWPELPGLQEYRLKSEGVYPILRVGVRERPKYLSPAWAATDTENRAVDLLFESLVNLAPDQQGVTFYRPGLAEGRIQVVPLGRQFRLPRQARWSDGEEMTAGDISFTIGQMKEGKSTGRAADWGELLEKVRIEGDAHRVKLLMKQGFIDPLALMSFKVLPNRNRPHPDSEEFAKKPITSGAFLFEGEDSEAGRSYTKFKINPHFRARGERKGMPYIHEIRLFTNADPAKDLKTGAVDLALDLSAEQAAALKKDGFEVPLPTDSTFDRRIYFLAVNNSKLGLKNADLRIAIARAIDREMLLDSYFRKGLERQVHRALNGPYPARSWACNPKMAKDEKSIDPYDPALAKTKVKEALTKLGMKELTLKLAYPAGDKVLAEAMTDLCARVSSVLQSVRLEPEECSPYALREKVEQTHTYELAYWHYDFPDETFWLMPLLGPGGKHGDNFLRYSGNLLTRVQTTTSVRHFADLKKLAHAIHQQHLEREMPFIPLWQLDPLLAYKSGRIDMPPSDANRLFAQIEQWRLK